MKLRCLGSLGSHHVLTSKGSGFEAERPISRSLLLSRRYMRRTWTWSLYQVLTLHGHFPYTWIATLISHLRPHPIQVDNPKEKKKWSFHSGFSAITQSCLICGILDSSLHWFVQTSQPLATHPYIAQSLCPQTSKVILDTSNPPWGAECSAALGRMDQNRSLVGMNQSWNLNIHFQNHQNKE